MEKLLERVEEIFERQIDKFEEKPLTSSFKALIMFFIIKYIWKNFKE